MVKISFFLLLMTASSVFSVNLPVEHETVRLMLAVEASVEVSDWEKASQQLNALVLLEAAELPDDFSYFNGLVNSKLGYVSKAEKNLKSYVVTVGKNGQYYMQALKLITLLNNNEAQHVKKDEALVVESSSILPSGERAGYIKSLQALYLTDDPVKALVMQINSLLSVHAYSGLRVKKAKARVGKVFSVSVNNNQLVLQEKNYESGYPSLTVTKLDVHGLDPFLRYECQKKKFVCSIYHPADTHLVWIVIDYDSLVAGELSEALTKLFQYLQRH